MTTSNPDYGTLAQGAGEGPVGDAGGAEPRGASDRSGGLLGLAMRSALVVGLLAGLAEACWQYLAPALTSQWQANLPQSLFGLARLLAAALATDIPLALVAGLVAWLAGVGAARVLDVSHASGWLRTTVRAAVIAPVAGLLYVGWITLDILVPDERGTDEYQAVLFGGLFAVVCGAMLASMAYSAAGRRLKRGVAAIPAAVALILLVAILTLFACAAGAAPRRAIEVAGDGPRPNIVLVTIDTLRSDYVRCYGHPWIETPTLDALAADGVLFETAIAQAPTTTPSHCSIMTGVYPFDHGAFNGKPMRAGLVTLAEALRAHGYRTAAFTSATTTRSINSRLDQGFDHYDDSLVPWSSLFRLDEFQRLVLFQLLGVQQDSQVSGAVVSDRALAWLERGGAPFFVWLHYFDPHAPYGAPPPYRGRYDGRIRDGKPEPRERERYAEDITFADAQLGRFVDALKRKNLYDDAVIIVTSDHGEGFGERHGRQQESRHGQHLYDTTQKVPLVIKPPGAKSLLRRVSEQVSLTDLAPTVLGYIQAPIPSAFVGKPLNALCAGRTFPFADRDAFAFNVAGVELKGRSGFAQQIAVRSPRWKYIAAPELDYAEMYDLTIDPHERSSVLLDRPGMAEALSAKILPFWDRKHDLYEDPRQRVAPGLLRELQALGYLGGSDADAHDAADDAPRGPG